MVMNFSFIPDNKLVNGEKFFGSTSYVDNHTTLRTIAGNSSWFTEFRPVQFPAISTFHRLLFLFYRHCLCRVITGSFVSYIAGYVIIFRAMSIYDFGQPSFRTFNFSKRYKLCSHFYHWLFLFRTFTSWYR